MPSDVSFDTGRSNIRPELAPILTKFAQGLDATMQVQVIGHTDSQGSDAVNNPLSLDRAQSVRDYLVSQGVSATRIAVDGQGRTPAHRRQQHRRRPRQEPPRRDLPARAGKSRLLKPPQRPGHRRPQPSTPSADDRSMLPHTPPLPRRLLTLASLTLLAGCALPPAEPAPQPRREHLWAVTDAAELVRFNAGQPQKVLQRLPLKGLAPGEQLVGMDFRVAKGVLYALTSGGQLCTLDTATGQLHPIGPAVAALKQPGRTGFDFNPVADRVRVVTESGQNLRLHPTRARWPPSIRRCRAPAPRASPGGLHLQHQERQAHDQLRGRPRHRQPGHAGLARVGPARVSPNTGRLFTVGPMGTGPVDDVAFDIADTDNTALAALRQQGRTRLHLLDLATGRATLLGTIGHGQALWGMAIEP